MILRTNSFLKLGSDGKPEVINSRRVAALVTGLGFLAFLVIAIGSIGIAPIVTYSIGGMPALITGIFFALVVSIKTPKRIALLILMVVGAMATMVSIFDTEVLKEDQWAAVAVGSASGVLTSFPALTFGLHFPGSPPLMDSRSRVSKVDEAAS